MAKGRKGSAIQHKLNIFCYGAPFSGKTTFALQFTKMKTEEGRPMRVLYLDCESGGVDNYVDMLEDEGINLDNLYIVYTSSLAEVLEYIDKIKNNEDFYELDDDGNETDTVVLDADGNPFRADAVVVDGASVLHMSVQQGLLEFSKKRARVRADEKGAVGDQKLVMIEGSSLEQKDWGTIKFKGQHLVLATKGAGVHCVITSREKEIMETVFKNGQATSVPTGKFTPEGFKGLEYNADTVIRFTSDEFGNVTAHVDKDRTGVHPKEDVEDPTLLDWQAYIDKGKGRKAFTIRNDLVDSVKTEQDIYSRELMNVAGEPISKSDMETEMAKEPPKDDSATLVSKITGLIKDMDTKAKSVKMAQIKAAKLPMAYKSIKDVAVLQQYISILEE